MRENQKMRTTFIVLIVVLVLALGYIGYDFYADWNQEKQMNMYQQGAQFGYEQAVFQLYSVATQCQQVPLTYDNQTINLIALECLQQEQ